MLRKYAEKQCNDWIYLKYPGFLIFFHFENMVKNLKVYSIVFGDMFSFHRLFYSYLTC